MKIQQTLCQRHSSQQYFRVRKVYFIYESPYKYNDTTLLQFTSKLSIISQFLKYSLQYFGIKIIQALHVKSRTWIKLISYLSLRGNG